MRFATLMACAAAAVISGVGFRAAQAQPNSAVEGNPLPRAVPLPPPDSLKPGAAADANDDARNLPQDKPVAMGALTVMCTGTGSSKEQVDWQGYPVRVTFSNAAAQYVSGIHVALSGGGKPVADFTCWAPWVLVKAPAGSSYKLVATIAGRADSPVKSAAFTVPSSGQKRVDIAFPEIKANE